MNVKKAPVVQKYFIKETRPYLQYKNLLCAQERVIPSVRQPRHTQRASSTTLKEHEPHAKQTPIDKTEIHFNQRRNYLDKDA